MLGARKELITTDLSSWYPLTRLEVGQTTGSSAAELILVEGSPFTSAKREHPFANIKACETISKKHMSNK